MPQNQQYGLPVAQNSLASMLAKNWSGQAKPGCATLENFSVTAGTPVQVLNVSGKGPGCVTSMWTTCAAPGAGATTQNMLNGLIQVYVDGEATPSISFDVGAPLGWQTSVTASNKSFTKYFSTEMQSATTQFVSPTCHNIFTPIPYQSSIIINFIPTQTSNSFFFNARYVSLSQKFPFKLFSQCTTYDNSIGTFGGNQWTPTQLGNGSVKLLNVPGGSGYISFASLYFLAAGTTLNALKCDINIYLDGKAPGTGYGTVTPDITASGIDGFFRYSANGSSGVPTPQSFLQAATTNSSGGLGTYHAALDIAAADGCWRFTNGAVMQIENGALGGASLNTSIGSLVLYYKDI